MFYAKFILAKKGPLAKIWLAAHWEKKLSKAHVFETDLQSSVESILAPKVKIALRTSGHLLLGVVRIYSRKAKYLLNDCNEALIKIKMAFRPGLVDLPEENREAQVAAITMPEFQEWDAIVNDLNNFDIQAQINLNQSRVEEITMKEDLVSTNFITDDNFFGDTPFGETNENEILRAGSTLDESAFKESDISKITIEEEVVSADHTSLRRSALDIALDEPIRDDGFGGEGMDFLDGFGAGEGVIPGFEELGGEAAPALEEPSIHDVTLEPLDITLAKENEQEGEKDDAEEEGGPAVVGDETTLLHNNQEAFALEPIEVTVGKDKRKRRKRKLIVDEKKSLTGDQIRMQISDTSDVVQAATVAPATKRRMKLAETSNIKSLFSMPSFELHSNRLVDFYKRNLTSNVSNGATHQAIVEEEAMDIDLSDEKDVNPQQEQEGQIDLPIIEELPPIEDLGPAMPEISIDNERENMHDLAEEQAVEEQPDIAEKELAEQEDNLGEQHTSEDQQDLTDDALEQKRWTKRAQQVMHSLDRELKKSKSKVSFSQISKKCSRKQAAFKFYALLILNKEKALEASENGLYGEINIVKGDRFEEMV